MQKTVNKPNFKIGEESNMRSEKLTNGLNVTEETILVDKGVAKLTNLYDTNIIIPTNTSTIIDSIYTFNICSSNNLADYFPSYIKVVA